MLSQIQIRDAIDVVLGWDLPDGVFGDAVVTQVSTSVKF